MRGSIVQKSLDVLSWLLTFKLKGNVRVSFSVFLFPLSSFGVMVYSTVPTNAHISVFDRQKREQEILVPVACRSSCGVPVYGGEDIQLLCRAAGPEGVVQSRCRRSAGAIRRQVCDSKGGFIFWSVLFLSFPFLCYNSRAGIDLTFFRIVIGTLESSDYALFVSHQHPGSQVLFPSFFSPFTTAY
jgi:hypothetical protein